MNVNSEEQNMKSQLKPLLFTLLIGTVAVFGSLLTACDCNTEPVGQAPGTLETDPENQILFSSITVNEAQPEQLTIYNNGQLDTTVTKIEIKNDTDGVFKVTKAPSLPFTLKAGKENGVKITVQFLTEKPGEYRGLLKIYSPDAINVGQDGAINVTLRHEQLTPDPTFECGDKLDFGAVDKGKSKTLECKIRNRGNAELIITDAKFNVEKGNKESFTITGPAYPIKIPADNTTLVGIKIKFEPKQYPPKEAQGTFVFETNMQVDREEDKPSLLVVGTVKVPLIELIPVYNPCTTNDDCTKIDSRLSCTEDTIGGNKICRQRANTTPILKFPLTSKGKTTKRTFMIRSTGDLPLQITQLDLDGTSSPDFLVNVVGLKFPITLNPKEEKEITVEYTPSDDKEDKGQVIVTSNAGNLPKAPVLLEADSRGCNLEVVPRKIKFPSARSTKVSLVNVGNESCLVEKVFLESNKNAPFSLIPTPTPNQTIAPNGRIDFLVKFTPPDKNQHKDYVVIESSDPDEPTIKLELDGQVAGDRECQLESSPTTLNFQLVPVGRSKKLSLNVTNKGWGDCNLKALNILGTKPSGNTAFQLTTKINTPQTLESGKALRIDISYTPAQSTGYEANLGIDSNDSKQPTFVIKLQGNSGNLCLEIVPFNMDFGSTKRGCATPTRDIEIYNLGAQGCSSSITVNKVELGTTTSTEFRFNQKPILPATLTAGQSIKIQMSYKAKDLGVDSGNLDIFNNIPGQNPTTVPLVGEGVDTNDQKDVFKQLNRPKTDIIFIIDNSCSMGDDQTALANNFQTFINWAVQLNVDYHIGATTTDVQGNRHPPGCLQGSVKYVTPSTPSPAQTFGQNAKLGTSGSATERGLEAAYRALIPPVSNSASCNQGFYRADASLSLIFVSDEVDQSTNPLGFYINFFKNLKGFRNSNLVRASAIGPTEESKCQTSGSCRYYAVANSLKGIYKHIKAQQWGQTLSSLGSITFGYRTQFFLSRKADPKTLKIKVNGTTVKEDPQDGWQYDPATNSINFAKSQIPPPGGTIQVEYKAICLP